MKILIDINHPAHVHLFKNFAWIMQKKGHEIIFTTIEKEVSLELLDCYGFKYFRLGSNQKGIIKKIITMFFYDMKLLKIGLKYNFDFYISHGSVYASIVSVLLRKPHFAFEDTEHAKLNNFISHLFSKTILTSKSYYNDLGKKHIKYNGYLELCYLHPNYFKLDSSILNILGVRKGEKYVVMRFVSWNASHDVGHSGLSLEMKRKAVNELSKYAKVFISSEGELPEDLKKYQIKIPPEKMHDALAFAALFVGEGATMASECAVLGTPAIYINSLELGYCTEEEKYGLLCNFRDFNGVLEKALEILRIPNLKLEWQKRRQKMLSDKIDVTAFMVWFIENYPDSIKIMKEKPDYQLRFI